MRTTTNHNLLVLLAVFFFGIFVFNGCKTKKINAALEPSHTLEFGKESKVAFLDSVSASIAITTDELDHFFERVTMAEMEIQMQTLTHYITREECLQDYVPFLKSDVQDFTQDEILKVSEVFADIKSMFLEVNPNLLNKEVVLIKTKGNHYGNSVYYTRENKIIIPANELESFNKEQFTQTMLHEFSHIFNRYNKESRDQLYDLIGFKEVRGPILLPETLGKRKLLNPDGTTDYSIKLKTNSGEEVLAYPLISASEDHYTRSKPSFFNYLVFHLYELRPMEDNVYKLVLDENDSTTIPFERIPSFFASIKDNTNYIIHPDEIMADNFIYAIYYFAKNKKIKNFSEEGMQLINDVGAILKSY